MSQGEGNSLLGSDQGPIEGTNEIPTTTSRRHRSGRFSRKPYPNFVKDFQNSDSDRSEIAAMRVAATASWVAMSAEEGISSIMQAFHGRRRKCSRSSSSSSRSSSLNPASEHAANGPVTKMKRGI